MKYTELPFKSEGEKKEMGKWVMNTPFSDLSGVSLCPAENIDWAWVYALFHANKRRRKEGSYTSLDDVYGYLMRKFNNKFNEKDIEVDTAEAKLSAGDIAGALDILLKLLDSGHPKALYLVGLCLHSGAGLQQDNEKAFTLLKMATESGYAPALPHLAIFYQYGIGVQKNPDLAKAAARDAAIVNDPSNSAILGKFFLDGFLVEQDIVKGEHLLRQAIANNDASAAFALGIRMFHDAVPDPNEEGFDFIVAAAEAQVTEAMVFLGSYFLKVSKDGNSSKDPADIRKHAISWLIAAAQLGDEDALHILQEEGVPMENTENN